MKPRIAFVVQRYGLQINGGSEAHCREVAERMLQWFDVEVLTTCASDHLSWKNEFPEGSSQLNGVTVRRFRCKSERQLGAFHQYYDRILTSQLSPEEERRMLEHQGPYCPDLLKYIERERGRYDAFIFFTFLYWTTIEGLPLVKDKAVFVPTCHDEPSLYVRILDEAFRLTPHMIFGSEEERFLVLRRFNLPESTGRVIGVGIEEPVEPERDDAWEELEGRLEGKQVLTYIGRVENGKGCDNLVDWFLRYVEQDAARDLVLLLLGKRTLPLPPHRQIVAPGFVSEYVKYKALQATTVAVAPSPFESLCLAALESWMHGKPVLANGHCAVLAGQCIRSNGGLWYRSYAEFREALKLLLGDESLRAALGAQGREYVRTRYRWSRLEQAYREEIEKVTGKAARQEAHVEAVEHS